MSSAQASSFIPELAPLALVVRAEVGVVALLVFEYVITLDQEFALFWRRKKTGATCLFLSNRYITLLCFAVLGAATFAPMSDHSCQTLQVFQFVITTIQYLPSAAFSGLRALALSGMNWWLACCIIILAATPFFGSIWQLTAGVTGANVPLFGCGAGLNGTPRQQFIRATVQCACNITADILVILVTWRYSIRTHGFPTAMRGGGTRSYLADIMAINGTIYFLLFMVINTIQLAFTVVSYFYALETIGIIMAFTAPLQAIMTGRFLMALQSADRRVVGGGLTSGVNADGQDTGADGGNTLRFASRVVGSIGGDLGTSYINTADEFDEYPADEEEDSVGNRGSACSREEERHSPSDGEA